MVPIPSPAVVTLLDAEGNQYQISDTIALCRCGRSSTKPFCDGTHETPKFEAARRAPHTLAPIATAA
jgi:CDGSH-type Zn-finger protein